jgi:glycogen phosphorylase
MIRDDSAVLSTDEFLIRREEIARISEETADPAACLAALVRLVQMRLQIDVCSTYLLEPDRSTLVLAATVGLNPRSIGKVRMKLHEGLTGMVAEQMAPVTVDEAARHRRYKYFPEAGEDLIHSFLGVPLIDRGQLQGVLTVQTVEPRTFTTADIERLVATARQLAPVISEARQLEQFITPSQRRLWALARNLWWCWDAETVALFRDLDPVRWRELGHNPIALLSEMSLDKLEERANQLVLHSRISYAHRRLEEYLSTTETWAETRAGVLRARPVAYFSAEFGLHESLPIYSGGLGVLAGDHLKSASDLDVPLVAVGLFYDHGYFRQKLNSEGWQVEDYLQVEHEQLPIAPAVDTQGRPIMLSIATRTGAIHAKVWQVQVGRIQLLLLDSSVEGNSPEDRQLTSRLYGGDGRVRIRQELLLGVGGLRALRAAGITPGVLHLNEGHSAFALLEEIRWRMQSEGLTFDEASQRVYRYSVFTTHTPVPAGHDRFSAELTEEHLGPVRDELGISYDQLLGLGRVDPDCNEEPFCMTVLALKLTRRANAVSSLHGEVSREMWTGLWPARPVDQVPIGHITNGIHVPSWIAPQMQRLYDRHLGRDWQMAIGSPKTWQDVGQISDGELWDIHSSLKARLLDFVRRRAFTQAQVRGESGDVQDHLRRALSPDALTIGFARRFATYKRAGLLFEDLDLLDSIVNDPKCPVQFVLAGKAHPRDEPGKGVLQRVFEISRDPRFLGKVILVEDYDIDVGRHFVQGVDVWLNNPRRPLEASGTSGQKVVLNGGLNLSILDGWWAEAYDGRNGFAIGLGETHSCVDTHDRRDADALVSVLRNQVVPLFYKRDRDGLPRDWIARIKRSIRTLGWRFSSDRMVMDYVQKCYVPAASGSHLASPTNPGLRPLLVSLATGLTLG